MFLSGSSSTTPAKTTASETSATRSSNLQENPRGHSISLTNSPKRSLIPSPPEGSPPPPPRQKQKRSQ